MVAELKRAIIAIISVKIDYTTLEGKNKNMLMVSANGTAVETD